MLVYFRCLLFSYLFSWYFLIDVSYLLQIYFAIALLTYYIISISTVGVGRRCHAGFLFFGTRLWSPFGIRQLQSNQQ